MLGWLSDLRAVAKLGNVVTWYDRDNCSSTTTKKQTEKEETEVTIFPSRACPSALTSFHQTLHLKRLTNNLQVTQGLITKNNEKQGIHTSTA